MSDVIIPYEFLCRGGTAAALASWNGIPRHRQLILETDTGRVKFGDGATNYNDLPYRNIGEIDFTGAADGYVVTWDAANSRFKVAPIDAGEVEYTPGSGSDLAADNVADALDELDANKVGDAPSDGSTYGRKDGAWAAVPSGGGGSLAWTLITAWDYAIDGAVASFDSASLAGYSECMMTCQGVTATASSWRCIRVSVDGGSTYLDSDPYYCRIDTAGVETAEDSLFFHSSASGSARSGTVTINALNSGINPKPTSSLARTGQDGFVKTASAITNVRVFMRSGNFSGGNIKIYAR